MNKLWSVKKVFSHSYYTETHLASCRATLMCCDTSVAKHWFGLYYGVIALERNSVQMIFYKAQDGTRASINSTEPHKIRAYKFP